MITTARRLGPGSRSTLASRRNHDRGQINSTAFGVMTSLWTLATVPARLELTARRPSTMTSTIDEAALTAGVTTRSFVDVETSHGKVL